MTASLTHHCLNCNASEASVPLMHWQYQGQRFSICADCLPIMIHQRHQLAEKLSTLTEPDPSREELWQGLWQCGEGPAGGRSTPRPGALLWLSLAGALAMTAWDLSIDPNMTRWGAWVWEAPGLYFDIPPQNCLGWLETTMDSGLSPV